MLTVQEKVRIQTSQVLSHRTTLTWESPQLSTERETKQRIIEKTFHVKVDNRITEWIIDHSPKTRPVNSQPSLMHPY